MGVQILDTDQYEYKDIKLVVDGKNITALRGVTLKKSMEKEILYGAGDKPQAIQKGNIAYEGEIKVLQSELSKIPERGKDLLDMGYFNISVVFSKEFGSTIETYTITNAQFTEYELGMEQGDKNAEIALPFIALDIVKS